MKAARKDKGGGEDDLGVRVEEVPFKRRDGKQNPDERPSGGPQKELWLAASHPSSFSTLLGRSPLGLEVGSELLCEWG